MRIKFFKLREQTEIYWKNVDVDSDVCMFHSEKNSTGKTTIMRAILYSLGFSIPNTEKVKFENYEFCISISNGKELTINRSRNLLTINNEQFDLPVDQLQAHSIIFETNNPELLSNLLGTIYFDQEKGWTLLNRGIVIGKNRFNIERFFRGLKGDESFDNYILDEKISSINKKIAQYNLMINISDYQNEIKQNSSNSFNFESYNSSLEFELNDLKIQLSEIEQEIKNVTNITKNNNSFFNYIEQKKLFVNNPGNKEQPIPVTKETLCYFSDFEDLNKTRQKILISERNEIKKKIARIESKYEEPHMNIEVDTVDDELTARLAHIEGINSIQIANLKSNLIKKKKEYEQCLEMRTKTDNKWIYLAKDIIYKYAKELKLPLDYDLDVFTSNLKSKSGAILHKMVFVYRLAYITLLSEVLGYPVPIFCDSPSGREVEKQTIEDMLRIVNRDFSNHQVFIASIFTFDEIFRKKKVIDVNSTLFDKKMFI